MTVYRDFHDPYRQNRDRPYNHKLIWLVRDEWPEAQLTPVEHMNPLMNVVGWKWAPAVDGEGPPVHPLTKAKEGKGMSKPGDISDADWDRALDAAALTTGKAPVVKVEMFARAIMAEREACAALCDTAQQECLRGRDEAKHGTPLRIMNQGAQTLARDLASAIRQRGEPL